MSVVDVKVNAKYYEDLAREALENRDVSQAMRHYRSALNLNNLTKEDTRRVKKEYAKALALRGKFSYSNRLLYEVLVEAPHDAEAYAILMFNFKSVDYTGAAQYYSKKAQPYLDKRRDDFKRYLEELNQDFLYYDDMEIAVEELNDAEFDRLISGEFPFIEEGLQKPKEKPVFTVLDHTKEFDDLMTKVYDTARQQDYAKAIDYANEAIRLNVSDDDKVSAYYAKCVALMMMGYTRESLELTDKMLQKYPNDNSFLILKAEIFVGMKDDENLVKTLSAFKNRPKDEVLPFERIINLYLSRGQYEEALSFVEPRIPFFSDSYTLLSYYGVILFDLGDIKKARSVFSDLNGIYGNLCDATHLLNYIKSGIDKPLLTIPQFGDIRELTDKYQNEMLLFLEQATQPALSYLAMDVEGFKSKLLWLIESGRLELSEAIIKKIYLISSYKTNSVSNRAIKNVLNWIFNLPATIDGLNPNIKEIIFEFELYCRDNFCYLDSWNLFKVSKDIFKGFDLPQPIWTAVSHSIASTMARDREGYKSTLAVVKELNRKYAIKKFTWKSQRTIYALIVYLAANRKVEPDTLVPGIIYDKKLLQKYLEEYDSVE